MKRRNTVRRKWYVLSLLIVILLLVSDKVQQENMRLLTIKAWNKIDEVLPSWVTGTPVELEDLQGTAALVMDRQSGKVLYGHHETMRMYPASTTKILTALILLENANPDELVTVGPEVNLRTEGESSAGLTEGDSLRVRDLVAAMMLPSGNDAARTAAVYVAKRKNSQQPLSTEDAFTYFAELMNRRAEEIGARKSHFVNPHGLHDPDHYTTARDMGMIAREAMNNQSFRSIVGESTYTADIKGKGEQVYQNRNQLLQNQNENQEWSFQGANGVKTGYTEKAGFCLVGSANRRDTELISVVLHSTKLGVWEDTVRLLNYGFQQQTRI